MQRPRRSAGSRTRKVLQSDEIMENWIPSEIQNASKAQEHRQLQRPDAANRALQPGPCKCLWTLASMIASRPWCHVRQIVDEIQDWVQEMDPDGLQRYNDRHKGERQIVDGVREFATKSRGYD